MATAKKPLQVFGDPVDEGALKQIKDCLKDERAVAGALMADHHLGYALPIGGVIAYDGAISPTGVGYDIACGNMAVRTNLTVQDLSTTHSVVAPDYDVVKALMRQIQKKVSFGVGRTNPVPIDHDLFDDEVWPWLEGVSPGLKKKAEQQLGTVGSGNHYVDLLVDEDDRVWVANHFGSRGLGHTIASGFMALDAGRDFTERVKEGESVVFDTDTELGAYYIACMELAGRYAYAGREEVIKQVVYGVLEAEIEDEIHNHHNFAWFENNQWVVRKGATPLTRERSFIGGSMGDISVIVRGRTHRPYFGGSGDGIEMLVDDRGALGSAPHGAGRTMSRNAAAGKIRKMWLCPGCKDTFRTEGTPSKATCPTCGSVSNKKIKTRDKSMAAIDWDAVRADLVDRNIVVLGAEADEAPGVYKDLETVLSLHTNIEVVHRLRPVGVVMAGSDVRDPYKD